MFLVGLTGGIASGKSSVIQVFQQLGCAVIDVDVIARHGECEGRLGDGAGQRPCAPLFHPAPSPVHKASEERRTFLSAQADVPLPAPCLSFPLYSSLS